MYKIREGKAYRVRDKCKHGLYQVEKFYKNIKYGDIVFVTKYHNLPSRSGSSVEVRKTDGSIINIMICFLDEL